MRSAGLHLSTGPRTPRDPPRSGSLDRLTCESHHRRSDQAAPRSGRPPPQSSPANRRDELTVRARTHAANDPRSHFPDQPDHSRTARSSAPMSQPAQPVATSSNQPRSEPRGSTQLPSPWVHVIRSRNSPDRPPHPTLTSRRIAPTPVIARRPTAAQPTPRVIGLCAAERPHLVTDFAGDAARTGAFWAAIMSGCDCAASALTTNVRAFMRLGGGRPQRRSFSLGLGLVLGVGRRGARGPGRWRCASAGSAERGRARGGRGGSMLFSTNSRSGPKCASIGFAHEL